MNGTEYPTLDTNVNQYIHFYGIDALVGGSAITPLTYKELFSIIRIQCLQTK